MNKRLLISLSLCLFLYGCNSSKKIFEEVDLNNAKLVKPSRYAHAFNQNENELVIAKKSHNFYMSHDIIQARLFDIPILFDAQLVCSSDQDEIYYLEYKILLSHEQVMNFYKDEMESFGWLQQMNYSADEALMLFKKAGRSCVISLRPVKKDWQHSKEIKIILVISH